MSEFEKVESLLPVGVQPAHAPFRLAKKAGLRMFLASEESLLGIYGPACKIPPVKAYWRMNGMIRAMVPGLTECYL